MSEINKRVRDMFGNFIQPGDIITYPCRKGSDTYMRTAKVMEIAEREVKEPELGQPEVQTVLKVTTCIAPRYSERKGNPGWRGDIALKATTVSEFYRSVVIPKSDSQNDERYKPLLEV